AGAAGAGRRSPGGARAGRTPLIAAAYMGHGGIVALLLSHGAHVDHADTDGRTALSVAAMCIPVSQGCAKVVELLLDHGASPGQADRDNVTPLLVAACEGHVDVVELLLEAGAEVDQDGHIPLMLAAREGHTDAVRGGRNATGVSEASPAPWPCAGHFPLGS
uniref:Uncharacterized protein n=1 Tax=Naja naja TaxID=35670 RepID=A0A8C7E3P3_NAJNA